MSFGSLYVAPSMRDGEPLEENWISRAGAEDFTALVDYQDDYMPGARRFDVGHHSNFHLVPMAIAAMEQIEEWGVSRIAATLAAVTGEIADGAEKLGLGVPPVERRAPHIIGLDLPVPAARRAAAALEAANVIASRRGASIRIAPHLHNNRDDVARLLTAIASAL
jgi:selenocysteine lyase/cysteine desulfurase